MYNVKKGSVIDTEKFIVVESIDWLWYGERARFPIEDNAKLIAYYLENSLYNGKSTKEKSDNHTLNALYEANDNRFEDDSRAFAVIETLKFFGNFVTKPLYKSSIDKFSKNFNLINTLLSRYRSNSGLIKTTNAVNMAKLVKESRCIEDGGFFTIHPKTSNGNICQAIVDQHCNQKFYYNYYSVNNISTAGNATFLKNWCRVQEYCVNNTNKIYFKKNKYYFNDLIYNENDFELEHEDDFYRKHQIEAIMQMESLEKDNVLLFNYDGIGPGYMSGNTINRFAIKTNFGILANEPGQGKTRIAVAVALRNKFSPGSPDDLAKYEPELMYFIENLSYDSKNTSEFMRITDYGEFTTKKEWINKEKLNYIKNSSKEYEYDKSTLIVVPSSTFYQWSDEIKLQIEKHKLDVVFHSMSRKPNNADVEIPQGCDIILMTDTFYNNYASKVNTPIIFNRIFYDETDTVRYKTGDDNIRGRFKWIISATAIRTIEESIKGTKYTADSKSRIGGYESSGVLINNIDACNIVVDFIRIATDGDVDNSNKLKFIEYKNFRDTRYIDHFREQFQRINPGLAEALASGDEDEINRLLGHDGSKACKMDRIYSKYLNENEKLKDQENFKTPNVQLRYNENLKELEELDKKLTTTVEDKLTTCPICICDMEPHEAIIYDCCFVFAHKECVSMLKESSGKERCPTCRTSPINMFNFNKTIIYSRLYNDAVQPTVEVVAVPKKTMASIKKEILNVRNDVFEYITRREGKKSLIYATGTTDDGLVAYLISNGFVDKKDFHILQGTKEQRDRIIQDYKSGRVPILILLKHKNVAGVNLQCTTDLIIYNRADDDILKQVIGRVDRIGLNHIVSIHLLDKFATTLGSIRKDYKNCEIKTFDIENNITFEDIGI